MLSRKMSPVACAQLQGPRTERNMVKRIFPGEISGMGWEAGVSEAWITFKVSRTALQSSRSGFSFSVSPRLLQPDTWCWVSQQTHTSTLLNLIWTREHRWSSRLEAGVWFLMMKNMGQASYLIFFT